MSSDILARLRAMQAEFTTIRRDLHAHPELGLREHRTAAVVAERLASWGIAVHRGVGGTGVVGVLHNAEPGRNDLPRIGLRADMDALPMREENRFAHASTEPGRMHACGHDGHTTMLLAAARYLAETRRFAGTVHFIFQPAEEGDGGAAAMLADGLFERFPCDSVFGLHNRPGLPVGQFGIRPGPAMAGVVFWDIRVRGKGVHAARPEAGHDPVVAGAAIVQALQSVVARSVAANDRAVVSTTRFEAGQAYNVIPEEVTLGGTVRAFSPAVMDLVEARMGAIAEGVAAGLGCSARLDFRRLCQPTVNDPAQAAAYADAAATLGAVDRDAPMTMGGEDFGAMLERVPGAYILVGNGDTEELHHPRYDFSDAAIPYGAGALAAIVEAKLARARAG